MSKITDIVSWVMEKEPLLKLKNANKTYDITDNVYEVIKKKKLHEKEDFAVEVEIDETKGENGTVTYLVAVDGKPSEEKPKEESKEEKKEEAPSDSIVKELTVNGVSVEKKGVIFKEEEKVWYTLDDSIDAQKFKDKYTKKVVEVYITPTEKGNDVITGFTAKDEGQNSKTDEPSKNTYSNGANATQLSIEAQASVNSANRVVANMSEILNDPAKVLSTIEKIAESNFELIQKLKNKE